MPENTPTQASTGPFDPFLNPVQGQQSYQSTGPKTLSGFEGKAGNTAFIVDKFLEGMSRGRAQAYQRSEQENSQRLGVIRQKMQEVQQANLPDETKQKLLTQLNQTFGQMVYHQIPGDEGGKGKKGGQDQQPADAGTHIRNALKNIVGGLIGPGAQKENISKEDLGKTIGTVDTILRDPNQSLSAQQGVAGQSLHQAFDAHVKAHNGQTPTTAEIMQDPPFFKAFQQSFGLTGKPTPEMQAILAVTDAESAKRTKIEEETSKQKLETERAVMQRKSAEDVAHIHEEGENKRVTAQQAGQNARTAAEIAANAPLRRAQIAKDYAEAAAARAKGQQTKADEGILVRTAQRLAGGDLTSLSSIASLRNEDRLKIYDLATQINPKFSPANTDRKIEMEKDYAIGKGSLRLQSFGTFLEHSGAASDAVDSFRARNPTSWTGAPIINKPVNWIRQHAAGDQDFQAFITSLEPVRKEFEGFLLGGRALYGEDRKSAEIILNDNSSPAQIQAALKTMGHTAVARFNEENYRYKKLLGHDLVDPFSAEAVEGANKIGVKLPQPDTAGGSAPPTASGGTPPAPAGQPTSKTPPAQQAAPGGPPPARTASTPQYSQTAVNPKTGQRVGWDGKQWVPIK